MNAGTVFVAFLRLGLTSFGGPIAHLGYFRDEFVVRRRWLPDSEYAELVALCQFLPGPASSQVGMAIGLRQAGLRGALAAWCGFTLPSALLMMAFAFGILRWGQGLPAGVLHGLKLVAVAVVAQAVWGMTRMFCRDAASWLLMLAAAVAMLLWPQATTQLWVIAVGALVGQFWYRRMLPAAGPGFAVAVSRRWGGVALALFAALLLLLPVMAERSPNATLSVFDAFYRVGSLVFGGGHVVLPLLQAEVVAPGWVAADEFLAGYGAAQALPGPLFAFSAFLGTAMSAGPGGWAGGWLCLVAIFLPSLLLVIGVLPFWSRIRQYRWMQAALAGVNAAVVGLLLAALYDPLWTTAVRDWHDVALVMLAAAALMWARLPPWCVVLAMAAVALAVGLAFP
ncbi:chromate efflux transporter [Pseudoxanthomonas wuyuanensis]|uniref:Chromate transporter n=1 Tax=Pseudoxanthomonas wuyuanensis TaxID=1073196 RepID=A0A286DCE3_9GAMM|nr:chromate efflux transporter [Pseudoxanthomonas wuyuanensis]SOD56303.1 chromate transporter [Pseudoxanthomonas wuyuanensis]